MKKTMKIRLAMDTAGTARHFDDNGFLHVDACHICKEKVYPYAGEELLDVFPELDPDGTYYAFLPAVVMQRALSSFEGLPLLLDHHDESAEAPQKEFRVGSTGTDAAYNAPYMDVSLHITDAEAIRRIQSGEQREISIGFFATYERAFGIFNNDPYEFVMTDLYGNHVALVEEGRAGHDCLVADSSPSVNGFAHWLKKHDLIRDLKTAARTAKYSF